MNVGILYSRIRRDEKLLLEELRDRGHDVTKIDVRRQQFDLTEPPEAFTDVDVLVDRCLATSRSVHVTQFAEAYGVPVVNSAETATVCANKVRNSLALSAAGIPTPATEVAFTKDAALEIVEFKALNEVAEVDVPGRVVDWLELRFGEQGVER